jgi:hypothetical protein
VIVRWVAGICQHGDIGQAWYGLLEKFQPLAGYVRLPPEKPVKLPPGPRETRHKSSPHRITHPLLKIGIVTVARFAAIAAGVP